MTSRSEAVLEEKLGAVRPMLDERTRRLLAANEALALGYGGVSCVHRACGLSRAAITSGIREIEEGVQLAPGRVRRSGAGRKRITVSDPSLLLALDRLIDPDTRGGPQAPAGSGGPARAWPGAAVRCRSQADHRLGPQPAPGAGPTDRSRHARRSRVAAAMGLPEYADARRRAAAAASSDQPCDGRRPPACTGLQPPKQPEG